MGYTNIVEQDALLTMAEVSEILGTDKNGIRRLEKDGKLSYIRINARVKRYRRAAIAAMLDKMEVKAS